MRSLNSYKQVILYESHQYESLDHWSSSHVQHISMTRIEWDHSTHLICVIQYESLEHWSSSHVQHISMTHIEWDHSTHSIGFLTHQHEFWHTHKQVIPYEWLNPTHFLNTSYLITQLFQKRCKQTHTHAHTHTHMHPRTHAHTHTHTRMHTHTHTYAQIHSHIFRNRTVTYVHIYTHI